jgi:hypothetical protein
MLLKIALIAVLREYPVRVSFSFKENEKSLFVANLLEWPIG